MFTKPRKGFFEKVLCVSAVGLAAFLPLLTGCSHSLQQTTPTETALPKQWVVGWGASPEDATESIGNPGGSDQTFRFIILPTIDGTEERIHFSNLLSKQPVTIGAARLAAAVGVGPSIDTTRDAALTFNGSTSVTLAVGQEVVSDPVKITYTYGEKLAVSAYVKGVFPPLTAHSAEVQNNFASAASGGDITTDASGAAYINNSIAWWFMLTGMDVYGSYQGTVAIFGSSSVDGHNSNYGNTNSYPTYNLPVAGQDNDRPSDWLARQLLAAGYRMGVLNAGAIGDPAGEDASTAAGVAIAGIDRMQRDVLQQAGIKTVVIYFGGIDLRSDCVSATNVEASLSNMVQQANTAGVRVILATLPPSEYCVSEAGYVPTSADPYLGDLNPGPENSGSTQRRTLNTWIRTVGPTLPGVISIADFDQVLADPAHPDFLIPSYVSGDNFHPNGNAYGIQSSAIPLSSILPQ
jgi:lysophospholipase L1-like esterase